MSKSKKNQFRTVNAQEDFPKKEKELLKKWYEKGIVNEYLHKNDNSSKKFSFLDGPITANNPMGVHHGWGRTYKDFWQKFWNMQGRAQRFQNGFDEQGLWVEVEVEKELGLRNKKDIENLVPGDKFRSLEVFINHCKDRVIKFSGIQTQQSMRLGYFMDWDNSYHTSSDENNYAIWNFLKVVNEKGWLYKGKDSVPWCPRCGTAISQHEILTEEYKQLSHESVFFKLPIMNRESEYLLVWTTTPWTIPSNVAVAVNIKEKYIAIKNENEILWIMEKRLNQLNKDEIIKKEKNVVKNLMGSELIGWEYEGPFDDIILVKKSLNNYKHRVIDGGDVVTDEEGTGLLHVAPGAGEEDFKLGKENNLPVISSIEEDASYVLEMGKFSGQNAKKHPELIIDELKSKKSGKYLLKTQIYKHRYPTCWRCKTELVWRVVDEWYIAMDKKDKDGKTYREQMIEVAKKIKWIPSWGLERELDWLNNMNDWLISKKRYWGLALPIYECSNCDKFEVIGSKCELKEKAVSGWDIFEGNSPHRPWVDAVKIKCSKCGKEISRINDVGNPWLDAGIVSYSTMSNEWRPADFKTESFPGQFKNWFYSLIAMSTALEKTNAFNKVLGFATVRDEMGEEMHKSKGNAIEFNEAADKIGVDVMRWMYLKQNPEYNLNFGFHNADDIRRLFILRLWNVYSFFVTYANLNNFNPDELKLESENILDNWILSRLNESIKKVEESAKSYAAYKAVEEIEKFIINDLSNWYVRRSRERVNPASGDENERNITLSILYIILREYSELLSIFIPFISEEIFTNLTNERSVHLSSWPKYDPNKINSDLHLIMNQVLSVVEKVHAKRKELNIKVRQPLANLKISKPAGISEKDIPSLQKLLAEELNIKRVELIDSQHDEYEKIKTDGFLLDTVITDDLKAEGDARDLVRKIQQQRKMLGTKLDEKIDVILPEWPGIYEDEIKRKALIRNLSKGEFKVMKI